MNEVNIPKVGDELTVSIDSVALGGEAVARHQNFVFFIPDCIPQEEVKIRVTELKKTFGRAIPLEILKPSPDRVVPPCPVYGHCGGCQYQHIRYERALVIKEKQLRETLERLGGISDPQVFEPILAAPRPYGYRNVINLRIRKIAKQWAAGYVGRDNKTFVPIQNCPIASPRINEAMGNIPSAMEEMDSPKYVRELVVREGKDQVLFYPHYREPYEYKSRDRLLFEYDNFKISYGLTSFFQVNPAMIPPMVRLIEEALEPDSRETLLDLYAGTGLFSILLSKKYEKVIGIETNQEAVQCFHENIEQNSLSNVVAVRGLVEEKIKDVFERFKGEVNSVLLDPPRLGLDKRAADFLVQTAFRKLVYVSCEPSTLARDLKILTQIYKVKKIWPLDLFPQTKHLEAIVLLEK